ncbi:coenzyme F420-0:L-glutamate ligase [Candidatus Bathyarchaeota archaeon]|nr:coenzyme F420-0:L-glutamate ligase [Candidatus Bathyarchaeota archaeon]
MTKYRALPVVTEYWKPGENYLNGILDAVEKRVANGDLVVVSEKALSTARGNIIDESSTSPSYNAKLISRLWMRIAWGYFLGVLCRLGPRLRQRLREYPLEAGSRHKQLALKQAGLLQALMWGSEGGIDGSNMPFSYVSLPLNKPYAVAALIHRQIWLKLKKKVFVIIVDTDKTYAFRNFFFTPHPKPMKGIHSLGGVTAYLVGRLFKFRKRPTPLAVAGGRLQAKEALKIANIADRARGPGSGATVWDMAARFNVATTGISWNMLSEVKHKPIVIVRKARKTPSH